MTQRKLAEHVGCYIKVINRIVNGRTSVGAVDRCVNRHSVSAGKTVETELDRYRRSFRLVFIGSSGV